MMALVADHLWQSTLFAALAGLLTLALRKNRPQVRYAVWLAASLKFLVPVAALAAVGARFGSRSPAMIAGPPLTFVVDSWDALSQPFSRPGAAVTQGTISTIIAAGLPILLLAVWFCGCAAILATWAVRWRRIAATVRTAPSIAQGREVDTLRRLERIAGVARPIRLVTSDTSFEPGAFGIWNPVLLWPRYIAEHLDNRQVEAILAHEVTHVMRRDNLAAALHMIVQALFWFHPLVWWIGARLVDERERACDAEVVRLGSDPRVYAESILKTCEFYVESPLVCVSGVTGSDLKKRIEQIMKNDPGATLNGWRKILLATAGIAVIVVPIAAGVLSAPRLRAQSSSPTDVTLGPPFASVSIKASAPDDAKSYPWATGPNGRFAVKNVRLRNVILYAYQVNIGHLWGGSEASSWISDKFDIEAQADGNPSGEQMRAMVRRLLADRFNLIVHAETRELPIYALVLARSDGTLGPQLRASECTGKATVMPSGPFDPKNPPPVSCGTMQTRPGSLTARWMMMGDVADFLAIMGRPVRDRTGLTGHYDLHAEWTADSRPPGPQAFGVGPATFTALEEQLGLRLVSDTGPVEGLVIDRAEKPAQN